MCGRFASSSCGRHHHGAGRHRRLINDAAATSAIAAATAAAGRRTRLPSRTRRTPHRAPYRTALSGAAHNVRRLTNMAVTVFRRTHHTNLRTRHNRYQTIPKQQCLMIILFYHCSRIIVNEF